MQFLLSHFIGARVQRIERLQYIYEHESDPLQDDLQLWLDGNVVRLRAGSDGERLDVEVTAWDDPFPEPLDPRNAAYVASHGRFVLLDVSAHDDYAQLSGARLLGYEPRCLPSGKVTGMTLFFETATLHAFVEFDQLEVSWSAPRPGS